MHRVFDKNLFILEELFGKEEVSVKLDRLKYIFENTEEKWAENLKLLKNSEIRYLLICEAPPFSEIEPPKYFYNYHNKNFNKEIWNSQRTVFLCSPHRQCWLRQISSLSPSYSYYSNSHKPIGRPQTPPGARPSFLL